MSEHPHSAFIVRVRAHLAKTETRNRYGLLRAMILQDTIQDLLKIFGGAGGITNTPGGA